MGGGLIPALGALLAQRVVVVVVVVVVLQLLA